MPENTAPDLFAECFAGNTECAQVAQEAVQAIHTGRRNLGDACSARD